MRYFLMAERRGFNSNRAEKAAMMFIALAAMKTVCHPPVEMLKKLAIGTSSAAVPLAV